MTGSTISGNSAKDSGGGIYNSYGDLTVTSSTINGNSADSGGGIFSTTELSEIRTSITGSTISGNSATTTGGGLFNFNGLTVIEFSTITGNQAPAGAGSGVASYGDSYTRTRVRSSIIAGNQNSDVNFVFDNTNSFQSNGYNLIGTGNALGRFNQSGDQTGVTNPLLGPLADNAGPTKTHKLLTGSPAIDAGNPAVVAGVGGVPAFDQRSASVCPCLQRRRCRRSTDRHRRVRAAANRGSRAARRLQSKWHRRRGGLHRVAQRARNDWDSPRSPLRTAAATALSTRPITESGNPTSVKRCLRQGQEVGRLQLQDGRTSANSIEASRWHRPRPRPVSSRNRRMSVRRRDLRGGPAAAGRCGVHDARATNTGSIDSRQSSGAHSCRRHGHLGLSAARPPQAYRSDFRGRPSSTCGP